MADRRLFFAIEFPDSVRDQLAAAGKKLAAEAAGGRWTRAGNIHLTLQFLGDCPDLWLPELEKILHQAAADIKPFPLTIEGCGTFGRQHDILWLGVASQASLQLVAARLTSLLRQNQLPCEDRPFSPHITIGREVRIDPAVLRAWTWPIITFPVTRVSLMESTRVNGQLTYIPIFRVAL